ncbi:MAG TPA: DEAD/DEAH box helicase [Candidatus Paceibacterota bacterium]
MQTKTTFADLGIAPGLLESLTRLKYTHPTPIQEKAIPAGIEGKDLVGIAQTGTGKTLAFGIPMIQRLAHVPGQGLVILPTRELALQVEEVYRRIGQSLGLRVAILIGGTGMGPQISALRNKPNVIIATPGRLIDHLEQRHLTLTHAKILVLDEADRMLDMGFAPQLKKIFAAVPPPAERQTMLFSATMPPEIMRIASSHMKLPISIEVAPQGTTVEKVTQEIFIVDKGSKTRLLEKLLVKYPVSTLVFTRTKFGAKRLARNIRDMRHSAVEIHGNRTLGQRKEALAGFKSGKFRVLVATDIAARGIDVVGIGLVVNFDLPTDPGDYVHRIGRTARAGAGGHAISFAEPNQRGDLRDIERLIKKSLPVSRIPT